MQTNKTKKPTINKNKNELLASFVYDKKIAKSFHNTDYYETQQDARQNIVEIDDIKKKMATSKKQKVDEIFEKYKEKGEKERIQIFGVLKKIKDKVVIRLKNKQDLPIHNDILSIISNKHILLQAYRTIRKNKGAMTPAYPIPEKELNNLDEDQKTLINHLFRLPDGLNWETINLISNLIKNNKYPWGCFASSRLIWIPKPGTKKLRPITIPPFADKIVQEAIRMVLEPIYEPVFQIMNCSFGFRARNGVHQAITMLRDPRYTSGMTHIIEGDIEQAYPNLDRNILVNVLAERIVDKKFLKFMKGRLNLRLYDTEKKAYEQTFLGIPQGGIDSPYLFNIYLLGMDEYIQNEIPKLLEQKNSQRLTNRGNDGVIRMLKNAPINPQYNKLDKLLVAQKKKIKNILKELDSFSKRKEYFKLLKEKKLIEHRKRQTSYNDPNRRKIKFVYVRYADDWVIATNAPPSINKEIKNLITIWLAEKRKATLSQEKTKITDIRKKPARFLGYEIINTPTRRLGYTKEEKSVLKRTHGWQITIGPDKERLINRLYMKGYCKKDGFPKEIPWLSTLDSYTIIEKFNAVMNGQANFYAGFINYPSSLYRWLYIIRWSCLKTLACKHHTTIRKIGRIYPGLSAKLKIHYKKKTYEKTIKLQTEKDTINLAVSRNRYTEISKELLEISKGNFPEYEGKNQGTPRILDSNFLEKITWVNFRTQANLDLPCMACGAPNAEMHHIKHIRKTKFSLIDPKNSVTRMQFLRNRKQVPLCVSCHDKVHNGTYSGKSLKNYVTTNYDNRSCASEAYIHSGIPYQGLPLEESLLEKGWIKK
jgi:retron-type reverse transcriptase